ncbi:MAG: hypothetical protein NTU85_01115 [Candidatus Kaiserbacteria bacterium]|nr:hypothetical protein [Candidatus Kaiserbacteria bacterium]
MPPELPTNNPLPPTIPSPMPSQKAQSWGTLLAIVVIVLMVIVGAFYAWGKRIAEQNTYAVPTATQ